MNNQEKTLTLAFFLNLSSHIFKVKGSEAGSLLTKLLNISGLLNPKVRELIEKASEQIVENPGLLDEINTRIEIGAISAYITDYIARDDASRVYLKAEIGGFYKSHGVRVRGEMPDHIAAILELLSLLLVKEAYLASKGDMEGARRCKEDLMKIYENYVKPGLDGILKNLEDTPYRLILEGIRTALESL